MSFTIKTPEEIEKMRVAGRLAAEVLQVVAPHVKPGVSTEELDRICHDHIVNVQKAIPANVGYRGFPATVCTSVNNVICHGIPSQAKVLKDGDIVNIDVTVIKDGWHGDTSRMYFAGTPSVMAKRLVDVTREAMFRGIRVVQPGATLGDIGHAIQQLRRGRALLGGARVLRPRHRPGLPRGSAGAALRPRRRRPGAEEGHDLHHRADDQRRRSATPGCCPTAGPWSPRTASSRRSGSTPSRSPTTASRSSPASRATTTTCEQAVPALPRTRRRRRRPDGTDAGWRGRGRVPRWREADAALAARFDRERRHRPPAGARARRRSMRWCAMPGRAASPADAPLALFAVGGYGRGELFPHSDIDLLVLAEADAQTAHHDALARLFALLWDAGLPVGHAVRSPAQCTQAAARRHHRADRAAGSAPAAGRRGRGRAACAMRSRRNGCGRRSEYFVAKREEQRTRHARFDDTSDNLEPNLKEGPGGLRDVQTAALDGAARARRARPASSWSRSASSAPTNSRRSSANAAPCRGLRFGLHLVAGKREERLRFDHQKPLAARLGMSTTRTTSPSSR